MATERFQLNPFNIPNYVTVKRLIVPKQDGFGSTSIPLAELSSQALDGLCNEFRQSVFEKAGKTDPRSKPRRFGGTGEALE